MEKSPICRLTFWKSGFLWITLLSVLAGGVATLYFFMIQGAFVSTGILLFDSDVATYRRLAADSFDAQRLDSWVASKGTADSVDLLQRLQGSLRSRAAFDSHFQPFLRVTKTDIRDLVSFKDDASNQIDGVAISFRATSASEAATLVQLGAQYLRDASLRNALFQWLQTESNKAAVEIPRWDEVFRTKTFQVSLLDSKLAGLRKITPAVSQESRRGQRDILSITDTTVKYLPLTVQQVGVESELIEVRRDLSNAQRELAMNRYILQFVAKSFAALANQETGIGSLAALNANLGSDKLAEAVAANTSSAVDAQERIRLQLESFRQKYVVRPLLARDTPQVADRSDHVWLVGILTAVGTALFLLAFALLPRLMRWVLAPEERRSEV